MNTFVTTQIEEIVRIDFEPTLIFGFYLYKHQTLFAEQSALLMQEYPDADIVGCSTGSVIGNASPYIDLSGSDKYVLIFTDMKKEAYSLNVFFDRSYESDAVVCDPGTAYAALLFSTHQNRLENDKVLGEIRRKLGTNELFGALAANTVLNIKGDAVSLYCNGEFRHKGYILLLIDEAVYRIQGESLGSFEPIGFEMDITKAEGNIIFEIDGKPALDTVEEMVGEMSSYGRDHYSYPFFIWNPENSYTKGALPLRTLLDIDRERKSLQFFNYIDTGYKIRPAIRIGEEKERRKLLEAHRNIAHSDLILLFVCIALQDFEEEMEHVYLMQLIDGTHAALGGFHTFGEIGYTNASAVSVLNNQTLTYVSITEGGKNADAE